jgi:hypothetical protein
MRYSGAMVRSSSATMRISSRARCSPTSWLTAAVRLPRFPSSSCTVCDTEACRRHRAGEPGARAAGGRFAKPGWSPGKDCLPSGRRSCPRGVSPNTVRGCEVDFSARHRALVAGGGRTVAQARAPRQRAQAHARHRRRRALRRLRLLHGGLRADRGGDRGLRGAGLRLLPRPRDRAVRPRGGRGARRLPRGSVAARRHLQRCERVPARRRVPVAGARQADRAGPRLLAPRRRLALGERDLGFADAPGQGARGCRAVAAGDTRGLGRHPAARHRPWLLRLIGRH